MLFREVTGVDNYFSYNSIKLLTLQEEKYAYRNGISTVN